MKTPDAKGQLVQRRLQHRHQMPLANRLGRADHLPLRDGVHGIDVVHAGLAISIALMDCVYPHPSRLAARIRLAPLADLYLPCLGPITRVQISCFTTFPRLKTLGIIQL